MSMTEKEFCLKRIELLGKHKREMNDLYAEFALANNTVKIGDIVTDGITTIKVEKIEVINGPYSKYPSCAYSGVKLVKNGNPAKNQNGNVVFQRNLK